MTCSLLVALRGCRRGRWHDDDGGEKVQIEEWLVKISETQLAPKSKSRPRAKQQSKEINLEILF